jgi:hypothetical protein
MNAGRPPWPSLSEINGWEASHLSAAAEHWAARANAWELAYTTVLDHVTNPIATAWTGAAADAATERIGTDRRTVVAAADALHSASNMARHGADRIVAAKQIALRTIEQAKAMGFDVDEQLTVTDQTVPATPGARGRRLAHARAHAQRVWAAADALAAIDRDVAAGIAAAGSVLKELRFTDQPGADSPSVAPFGNQVPGIGPISEGPHLIYCYPSAQPNFWWCEGYDVGGGGPYGFGSPFDVSGVG